jgi:hypothetical protein
MKLIDDIGAIWKFWTVKIQASSLALMALWTASPQDWRDAIPKKALIAVMAAVALSTIFARGVKQGLKPNEPPCGEKPDGGT